VSACIGTDTGKQGHHTTISPSSKEELLKDELIQRAKQRQAEELALKLQGEEIQCGENKCVIQGRDIEHFPS
jgi:hypothetical protein